MLRTVSLLSPGLMFSLVEGICLYKPQGLGNARHQRGLESNLSSLLPFQGSLLALPPPCPW